MSLERTFMQRRLLPRRPSQISDPNINFVFAGTGTALEIQHTVLLFLPDRQDVWTSELLVLSQTSVNLFRVTIMWRQVDTPSVASVPSLIFHISDDDEF